MDPNEKDKRTCIRFNIEGATLSYKKLKLLSLSPDYNEKNCPILNLSRGGCRFLTQKPIKANTNLLVEIDLAGEEQPLFFYGETIWFLPNPGFSYKYQIGFQFNAYGEDEKQNSLSNLDIIKKLELTCSDDSSL